MKENKTNLNNSFEEDSIDIVNYIKNIWIERKLIAEVTTSFFFIGFFIAVFIPVLYTSQTTFVP